MPRGFFTGRLGNIEVAGPALDGRVADPLRFAETNTMAREGGVRVVGETMWSVGRDQERQLILSREARGAP